MFDPADSWHHVKPYVHDGVGSKALHFSIGETQSRMRLDEPDALDLEYTRTMMGFLLFLADPAQITMIGLGGGSLAKFCHRHLPRARILVVEINPHVIALRDDFHVPPDDERFTVVRGDGAQFVRLHPDGADVLLVDGFDSEGLPAQLCSQRFYDDCAEALRPGGIMVANLHYGHPHYALHLERIRRRFGADMLVVDEGALCNSIVFACKGPALRRRRTGAVRHPKILAPAAANQLLGGFALIASALKDRER